MSSRCVAAAFVVACLLALTACGSDSNPDGYEPKPAPDRQEERPLDDGLVYVRTGGLAGRTHSLSLNPDGRARFESSGVGGRSVTLRPAELESVERAVAALDPAELRDEYKPAKPVPDGFGEAVSYGQLTVAVETGGDEPDEVRRLMATLSALADRYSPKR